MPKGKETQDRLLKRLSHPDRKRQEYIRRMITIELPELATV